MAEKLHDRDIGDMLHAELSDDDIASDCSNAPPEESDHNTDSEIGGDDSDFDENYDPGTEKRISVFNQFQNSYHDQFQSDLDQSNNQISDRLSLPTLERENLFKNLLHQSDLRDNFPIQILSATHSPDKNIDKFPKNTPGPSYFDETSCPNIPSTSGHHEQSATAPSRIVPDRQCKKPLKRKRDDFSEENETNLGDLLGDDTDSDPDFLPHQSRFQEAPFGRKYINTSKTNLPYSGRMIHHPIAPAQHTVCDPSPDPARNRLEGNDQTPAQQSDETDMRVAARCILGRRSKAMIKKNIPAYKWSLDPPPYSRSRAHNIITKLPGVVGNARENQPKNSLQAWRFFIDDQMLEEILQHTNEKINELSVRYGEKSLACQFTNYVDKIELEAFLGLAYLAGVFKSNHEDVRALFATDGTGRDIFRATMTQQRFLFLLNALRFDYAETREERKIGNPLAAVSEIFDRFVLNCKSNYSCGQYTTVDEMLVPFRGKFRYRVYMKSKPAKYGLKIFILADSRTFYFVNGFIYCGDREPNIRTLLKPTQVVMSVVQSILKTNRNITGDNYFSSLELVDELQKNGLTYVDTMRKNKIEIPYSFLPSPQREILSTDFAFTANKTLVSYVPRYNKSVVIISSMHHEKSVLEQRSDKLPEVIDFYNTTKVGVDSLDQKCAQFLVGCRTRRWSMAIWFAVMDIAGVNARIIFQSCHPDQRFCSH